uniref:Tetraspanin-13 n=1 Tax=Sphaerodactylus townsendi TaxID=933632 RepID=A0ACB8FW07_9SAUR
MQYCNIIVQAAAVRSGLRNFHALKFVVDWDGLTSEYFQKTQPKTMAKEAYDHAGPVCKDKETCFITVTEDFPAFEQRIFLELVSLLLIGIAAWGIGFGLISSFRVVGVAIAVGIFLFLIALVGLIGAVKHHQVLLFFMLLVFVETSKACSVFIIQFSVSCACLTLNKDQQSQLLEVGWNNTNSAKQDIERNLNCCGFRNVNKDEVCSAACSDDISHCSLCAPIIEEYSGMVLRFVGGIGLFFSFTEILGVWLTYRYRNQKDPRANPSAFL